MRAAKQRLEEPCLRPQMLTAGHNDRAHCCPQEFWSGHLLPEQPKEHLRVGAAGGGNGEAGLSRAEAAPGQGCSRLLSADPAAQGPALRTSFPTPEPLSATPPAPGGTEAVSFEDTPAPSQDVVRRGLQLPQEQHSVDVRVSPPLLVRVLGCPTLPDPSLRLPGSRQGCSEPSSLAAHCWSPPAEGEHPWGLLQCKSTQKGWPEPAVALGKDL